MTFLKVAMRGGLIRGLNDTLFRIFVRNASLAISGAGFICDQPPRKLFSHAFLNIGVNRRFQISRWSRLPTLHYTRHNSSGQCQNFLLFCWSQNCRVNWALIFTEALDKNCNYNMHTLSRLRLTLGKFSIKVTLKIPQNNKSYL